MEVRLATRLGQLQLQPLDLDGANFCFVLRGGEHLALGEDHRMLARQIVRKVVPEALGDLAALGAWRRRWNAGPAALADPAGLAAAKPRGVQLRGPTSAAREVRPWAESEWAAQTRPSPIAAL